MARTPAKGNARFTTRYSQAQKDALLHAVMVDGHAIAEAIRMANTGQLGIPAFEIARYGYDIIRDGREQFEATNDLALDRAIDAELKRTATLALAHNRALLAKARRDGTDDPDQLRRSAQALSAIKKARRDAQTNGARPKAATNDTAYTNTETRETTGVVGELLDIAAKGARTGSLNHAKTGRDAA